MDYGLASLRDRRPVALKAVSIEGDMVGSALLVTIMQQYINDSGQNAEFIYSFPLPEQAAVCDFNAKIGQRHVTGEIGEKEQSIDKYNKAIENGNSAFLLEAIRPNVFQVSLGQIDDGEEVQIKISYFQEIKIDETDMRIAIPTLWAPRYSPDEISLRDKSQGTPNINPPWQDVDYRATMVLNLKTLIPITEINSPSHKLNVEQKDPFSATITLAEGQTKLDTDIVINLQLLGEMPQKVIYAQADENEYFALAAYTPELPARYNTEPKNYIFLIDISGSMEGQKLTQAARALQICLRNLSKGDTFNIVAFESRLHTFSSHSMEYNQKNLDKASQWVKSLGAMGGTEIMSAIQFALPNFDKRERIVVLFTDGQVDNEAEIIDYVRQYSARTRLYSLGIDTAVNSYFINQLAAEGHGYAEFAYPGEDLEMKVLRHFSRINSCYLDKPKFRISGTSINDLATELPDRLYDMESYTTVFRLSLPPTGNITVTGLCDGQEYKLVIDEWQRLDNPSVLQKLWAKRKIVALEDYLPNVNPRRAASVKETIIDISKKYRVLSTLTAFLAVYEREEKLTGMPSLNIIPLDIPKGWRMLRKGDSLFDHVYYEIPPDVQFSSMEHNIVANSFTTMYDLGLESVKYSRKKTKDNAPVTEPSDQLKELAANQIYDGSFGSIKSGKATLIASTAEAIIQFCSNAAEIGLYRRQLLKAVDYLMSVEKEILKDRELLEKVREALVLARDRKIIRPGTNTQNEFAERMLAIKE